MPFERTVIFGGSRGLGLSLVKQLSSNPEDLMVLSRNAPNEKGLCTHLPADLSKPEDFAKWMVLINDFQPQRAIYCAGGGPFGKFEDSNWKSHQWALQVTFLSAAWWLHEMLSMESVSQFVLIGSSVAEDSPDPMASSYCAAKHAIKGLHSSIIKEGVDKDVRLYSPGYMDTDLLPKGSWPRQQEKALWSPETVASDLLQWSDDSAQTRSHKALGQWADDA